MINYSKPITAKDRQRLKKEKWSFIIELLLLKNKPTIHYKSKFTKK
jgi:hypothetical protein